MDGNLTLSEDQLMKLKPFLSKSYFNYEELKDEMPNLAICANIIVNVVQYYCLNQLGNGPKKVLKTDA
jgi:hypothetical protein